MVLCIVVGCSNRSGRDKGVSFYRIPVVRSAAAGRSPREVELSKARRAGFLAAISRDDLTESKLENKRICSRHFISGKPADLFDELNPDWLPTQHLRPIAVVHSGSNERKRSCSDDQTGRRSEDRYLRKKARMARARMESRTRENGEQEQHNDETLVGNEVEGLLGVSDAETQTDETAEDIALLRTELNNAYHTIGTLKDEIVHTTPFTESFMQKAGDNYIQHYTGLPNFKLLKTLLDFVTPKEQVRTKLSPFQEFIITLLK